MGKGNLVLSKRTSKPSSTEDDPVDRLQRADSEHPILAASGTTETKLGRARKRHVALSVSDRAVATAMAAGAGFNTGAVVWPVGNRGKRSPNRAEIRRLRRILLRWLRKHGRTHPDLAAMHAVIAACGRHRLRDRCLHPACPRCATALQRLLVRTVSRFTNGHPEDVWITITIILPVLDSGGEPDFGAVRDQAETILREAGITLGVFGFDLSANEDHRRSRPDAERFADFYCVHLYGLAPAAQVKAAKPKLKRRIPATDAVPRPVKTETWDGRLSALGYMLKGEFQRRQTIEEPDERRGKLVRDTRDRPLLVEQRIQAVRALARAGLTGRILLLGLSFEATPLGRLRLVLTT